MKFHFGLGGYFSPFEKEHREALRRSIEASFGIHYCLDYTASDNFFRNNTTRNERTKTSLISRVPAFDTAILRKEVESTLRSLDMEKIDYLQLWGGLEVLDCYNPESNLYSVLKELQREGKVCNFLPQLYYDQTIKLKTISNLEEPISFAFYGSPKGLHINKDVLTSSNINNCIALSIFGGVDKNAMPQINTEQQKEAWERLNINLNWASLCLSYLESLKFVSCVVGTTRKVKHIEEIVDFFINKENILDTDLLLLQEIAIQSCTQEHKGPIDAGVRWNNEHKVFRAKSTVIRYHLGFLISKNKELAKYLRKLKNYFKSFQNK